MFRLRKIIDRARKVLYTLRKEDICMLTNHLDHLIWLNRTTATALAEKTGISAVTIRATIKDPHRGMALETAMVLAHALDVPIGEFVSWEPEAGLTPVVD